MISLLDPYMDENQHKELAPLEKTHLPSLREHNYEPIPDPLVSKAMWYWLGTSGFMYIVGWELLGLIILLCVGYTRYKQYQRGEQTRSYNKAIKPLKKNTIELKSKRAPEIEQAGRALAELPRSERDRIRTIWDEMLIIDEHLANHESLEAHNDLTERLNAVNGVVIESKNRLALEQKRLEQEAEFQRRLDEVDAHHRYQLSLNPMELEMAKHLQETLAAENQEQEKVLQKDEEIIKSVISESKKKPELW